MAAPSHDSSSPEMPSGPPVLSLIMPCFNEAGNIGYTIPRLLRAFGQAGYPLQIVAVNNGSADETGRLLEDMAAEDRRITTVHVETNIGLGFGILSGIAHCHAEWIGIVAADGQVDEEDLVRLFDAARAAQWPVLAKVRRRFRMDGFLRKIVSIGYNAFVWVLFPRLGSLDVNGNPRLMPRDVLRAMHLESPNWLIDPEMLIKAHYLGVRVLELNVFARMRGNGLSHVRASTCWEFARHLVQFRFAGRYRRWRHELSLPAREEQPTSGSP